MTLPSPRRSGRLARVLGFCLLPVVLLGATIYWQGDRRVSSGPATGTVLNGGDLRNAGTDPSATERTRLRIATFNIHSGIGPDGVYDLQRTADCLDNFDLAGLNEVRGQNFSRDANQAEMLGQVLDSRWLFAPTERRWWRDDFGNGLLAKVPVRSWMRIPLPCSRDKGFRNVLLVTTELAGKPVRLLHTHLDRSHDREPQLQAVIGLFLAVAEPVILTGDLNTTADDPQLKELLDRPGVVDAYGEHFPEEVPGRIDWIIARGLRCTAAGRREQGASDHPLVWAEFERE